MKSKRRKPIQPQRRTVRNAPRSGRAAAATVNDKKLAQLTRERDEALEQQTATSEILGVISRSPTDVQPVLDTIVRAAVALCDSYDAVILLKDGENLRIAAHHGPMTLDFTGAPISRDWVAGRTVVDRRPLHVHDLPAAGDEFPLGSVIARRLKQRTVLGLPLLRDEQAIGCLFLRRTVVTPFSEKQIALLQTFADQAVIAIENVRLFESVEARTRELAKSLEELRTAQDFSAVSVELIDELRAALGAAHLDGKLRAEVGEIADTLQGNLDKVVQHGKRADAIVKNMLLHSREGSGERRLVDVNALVEESLNLAYHGARAEKQGFNISLERSFDPAAGEVDVFPQEITRVLLNVIANGFYAATRRQGQPANDGFEPTVSAATKSLGDRVEIKIRDNGTGISTDVKEKMFNPFFTTKPAGEGTGLGLSISHDIIVKQHSGSIEVDTTPGEFTEFRIILPRVAAPLAKSGEQA